MNNLTLRRAIETDAAVLCEAERETARVPGRLISQPSEFSPEAFARKIQKLSGDGLYLVAERDGSCVGHALLNL
ncbi:hypothetical protein [Pseudomonas sp. RIT-PI-S]|uniref:hypothetical protein n=1 Tax=Pseudomonas sp. RIT-PI-S TaxID=3035295 RepID=UPI0021D8CDBD|nr:hypothetical protein [Pseudomonas sp. RIT-PI-S]